MGIAARHLNRFVAHQFLNPPQVNSRHGEARRERVSQIVPSEASDAGLFYRILKPVAIADERFIVHAQEHMIAFGFRGSGL